MITSAMSSISSGSSMSAMSAKYSASCADLVGIAQGGREDALAARLQHQHALAPASTTRPMPTIFFAAIASRITANASSATLSSGAR